MAQCTRAGRRTDPASASGLVAIVTACRRRARLPVINSAGCTRFDHSGRAVYTSKLKKKTLVINI